MSIEEWIPDIVIGVDFGMTCTGMFVHDHSNYP